MKNVLLIGGSNDGATVANPPNGQDRIKMLIKSHKTRIDRVDSLLSPIREASPCEYYDRMRVGAGDLVTSVFKHTSLSEADVMKAFIANYHPTSKEPMNDVDWHQVQEFTGFDIMDIVMDLMQGRKTPQETMQRISDHCGAAFNVGRGIKVNEA